MPWQETSVMDQRMGFIAGCLEGDESIAGLCRHFGISRKTGHKWLARYRAEGAPGLVDRSRAPLCNPRALAEDVAAAVLAVRQRRPSWGPRKVKAWLEDRHREQDWPAASTMGEVFDRAGLTKPRKRRRRVAPQSAPLAACRAANDMWCADFKGWFLAGDGTQVQPFTLSDAHSRFLIRCKTDEERAALRRADEAHVWPILEAAFREYGLPRVPRSDNSLPRTRSGGRPSPA
jgi:putative transposase